MALSIGGAQVNVYKCFLPCIATPACLTTSAPPTAVLWFVDSSKMLTSSSSLTSHEASFKRILYRGRTHRWRDHDTAFVCTARAARVSITSSLVVLMDGWLEILAEQRHAKYYIIKSSDDRVRAKLGLLITPFDCGGRLADCVGELPRIRTPYAYISPRSRSLPVMSRTYGSRP